MSSFDLRVGTCGCCEPQAPATPEPIVNRPALGAVAYRTGTWTSFRRSMIDLVPVMAEGLAAEHGLAARPLDRWTSRRDDDYGIALIDMWATLADLLTFYQERYANRAWLRTAADRDVVRRLAALLGYRLAPGVAAGTHLAVAVEDGIALTVPSGLRVQSVPGDGEQPQPFEVDAPVEATSTLNAVRVFGAPRTATPLAADSTGGTLAAGSVRPRRGDELLVCASGAGVERRTVTAVDDVDGRAVVRWSPPLAGAHDHAFVPGRTHRVFGHSEPATWASATVDETTNTVTWTPGSATYSYTESTINLDGAVDTIEVGDTVVVMAAGVADVRTVETVSVGTAQVGPTAGPATAIGVDGDPITHDVRTTVVHEVTAELTFQEWELPDDPLPAGTTTVHVPYPEVDAIADGRLLLLDDDAGAPLLTAADGDAVTVSPDDEPEFLEVTLATATTRELDAASAVLLGNVAPASHGAAVVDEVLGDGAAAEALQAFELAKAPVTHVADPTAPGGARSTLEVLVDGVRWSPLRTLLGAAADARVYTTAIDDAVMTVRFGDGVTGARLPTGRGNVVAGYRTGLGVDGNLAAGQISNALDRPTGLRAVHNPLPSTGGVDPETTDAARERAPATVRTFDRAVALDDFAHLARDYLGVAKALATWVWDGEERVVHVTVGGEDGAPLDAVVATLRAYLDARRDPNRTLRLDPYRSVPFVVRLRVDVAEDRRTADVAASVTDAVADYFAYDARAFGQAVHLSDVYHVVHTVDGVESAFVTALDYRDAADRADHAGTHAPRGYDGTRPPSRVTDREVLARRPPLRGRVIPGFPGFPGEVPFPELPSVLLHAPIAGARYERSTGTILPAELATLDADDLLVTATGGIAS